MLSSPTLKIADKIARAVWYVQNANSKNLEMCTIENYKKNPSDFQKWFLFPNKSISPRVYMQLLFATDPLH